jgi:hypothetical protein
MFTIPVGDILASYSGDSKEFSFSGEIFDGYYDDIAFLTPLEFSIKLISLDDGVQAMFQNLNTRVRYEDREHDVTIGGFDRTWQKHIDPLTDDDDVQRLDIHSMTIDLAPVIREEIIMACHEL